MPYLCPPETGNGFRAIQIGVSANGLQRMVVTMKEKEQIKVFLKIRNGRTVCICLRNQQCKCRSGDCQSEVVERDKFRGWESTLSRNRYGKSQ